MGTSTRRALVIGGSLGGLFAAHLLRSEGWDARVFERNPEDLTGRGAGLSTHPQLLDILQRIGIDFDATMGVTLDRIIFFDASGRVLVEENTARLMSSWGRLYRALRDPLPAASYRLGMSLIRVEQDARAVTAVFANGERIEGELLVGADGGRSTVREQFLPDLAPQYAGYVAWRAMLDESAVPPAIRAQVFERYTFCLPEGELFLAYPVPGRNNETEVGRRAYNIVWYRAADPDSAPQSLHRCEREISRPRHSPAAHSPRRHRRDQSDGAGAGRPAARGNLLARAAVLSADLRSGKPAHGIRARRALGRRCLCGAPACRGGRDQGGARSGKPRRGGAGRGRTRRAPALCARAAAVRARPRGGGQARRRLSLRAAQATSRTHARRAQPHVGGSAPRAQYPQREPARRAGRRTAGGTGRSNTSP